MAWLAERMAFWGDEVGAVVADVGSYAGKFGWAGEDAPRRAVPTLFGAAPTQQQLEETWTRGLGEMWTELKGRPVLAAVDALATDAARAAYAEMLLEKFGASACFLARAPVLGAFASGRASALVVDVGHTAACVTPVVDGFSMLGASRRCELAGGAALTQKARGMLAEAVLSQHKKHVEVPVSVAEDAKSTVLRAWRIPPFEEELAKELDPVEFVLPDGTKLSLGPERFAVCEFAFDGASALAATVHASLEALDPDVRRAQAQEVIVVGGASLLDGLGERLGKDLADRLPNAFKPRVVAPGSKTERQFATFVGGSVLASLGTFQQLWLSRKEWDEVGASRAVAERFIH